MIRRDRRDEHYVTFPDDNLKGLDSRQRLCENIRRYELRQITCRLPKCEEHLLTTNVTAIMITSLAVAVTSGGNPKVENALLHFSFVSFRSAADRRARNVNRVSLRRASKCSTSKSQCRRHVVLNGCVVAGVS